MRQDLTIKQEKFALKYIETGNASEAYRQAYKAENMKPETINREAFGLLENPKITTRIDEIQAEYRKEHEVTVEYITDGLKEVAFLSRLKGEYNWVRQSYMDMAKLHGLVIERKVIEGEIRIDKKRGAIASRWAKKRAEKLKDE